MTPYIKIIAAGAIAVAGFAAGYAWEHRARTAEVAQLRAEHAATLQNIAALTAKAAEAFRAREGQWATAQQENARVTDQQAKASALAAAASSAAADRLRQQVADYRRRAAAGATTNPGAPAAGPGESGADSLDLFAGLLERHSRELEQVGRFSDQLRDAGLSCERHADSLTKAP